MENFAKKPQKFVGRREEGVKKLKILHFLALNWRLATSKKPEAKNA